MTKRFILFSCCPYYPKGGARDFKGSFDTEQEAMAAHAKLYEEDDYLNDVANILDTATTSIKRFRGVDKATNIAVWTAFEDLPLAPDNNEEGA